MPQNTPHTSPKDAMNIYARAAANLYGVIGIDDFLTVLRSYYGFDSINREKVFLYFQNNKSDPGYYIEGKFLVHGSIPSGKSCDVLRDIQDRSSVTGGRRRILPEKEFLAYANPSYYEETPGTAEMRELLTKTIGISAKDAEEILSEMTFVCRADGSPTLLLDALSRRNLAPDGDYEMDIVLSGTAIDRHSRHWEDLGFTRFELDS